MKRILLAALCMLPVPAWAGPVPAAAPITLEHCALTNKATFDVPVDGYAALDVTYRVNGPSEVTRVRIAISSPAAILAMRDDVGEFSPGARVRHKLPVDEEMLRATDDARCQVVSATFADGTTWRAPGVAPDMAHALPQTEDSRLRITRCYPSLAKRAGANGLLLDPSSVSVSFSNQAAVPATAVDIGLVQNGALVWQHTARGTFSPGVVVEPQWEPARHVIVSDALPSTCVVLGVTYADGTSWKAPYVPKESPGPPVGASASVLPELTIESCRLRPITEPMFFPNWTVGFRNSGSRRMDLVEFALVSSGTIVAVATVRGQFDPGIVITKELWLYERDELANQACIPLRIRYADGTEWRR